MRAPESNSDYSARLKSEDEFAQDFAAFFADMPENATGADWLRFADSLRLTVGKESNERDPSSARVPDLFAPGQTLANPSPSKAETSAHLKDGAKGQEAEEMTDVLRQLLLSTGYTMETVRSLKTKTVVAHAVVNQTRLGKIRRQYCLSIAGNGQGLLGLGEAKSDEGTDAMLQSKYRAIRNMQPIPRYESRTIFGDVSGKVGAVVSNLMTSPPGTYYLSVPVVTTAYHMTRIRSPLSIPNFRNVPCGRDPRSGRSGKPFEKPNEHGQGYV